MANLLMPVLGVNTDLMASVKNLPEQVNIKALSVSMLQAPHADNNHARYLCGRALETMGGQKFSDIAMASGGAFARRLIANPDIHGFVPRQLAVLESCFALASAQSSSPVASKPTSVPQVSSESGPIFDKSRKCHRQRK